MSAQVAHLETWLQQAVMAQAVSLAEAWTLQDLALLLPPELEVEVPQALHPTMERLFLWETPAHNSLPI